MPAAESIITALNRNWAMVDSALEGLDDDTLARQPAEQCNSIAWILWHMTRVVDSFIHTRLRGGRPVVGTGRLASEVWHE